MIAAQAFRLSCDPYLPGRGWGVFRQIRRARSSGLRDAGSLGFSRPILNFGSKFVISGPSRIAVGRYLPSIPKRIRTSNLRLRSVRRHAGHFNHSSQVVVLHAFTFSPLFHNASTKCRFRELVGGLVGGIFRRDLSSQCSFLSPRPIPNKRCDYETLPAAAVRPNPPFPSGRFIDCLCSQGPHR